MSDIVAEFSSPNAWGKLLAIFKCGYNLYDAQKNYERSYGHLCKLEFSEIK
jgi:hypothetical protein